MSSFTFIEDEQPLGFIHDLRKFRGAEADWGNSYIHVHLADTSKPLSIYFKSEAQLKYEFVRLCVESEPYRLAAEGVKQLKTQPQP